HSAGSRPAASAASWARRPSITTPSSRRSPSPWIEHHPATTDGAFPAGRDARRPSEPTDHSHRTPDKPRRSPMRSRDAARRESNGFSSRLTGIAFGFVFVLGLIPWLVLADDGETPSA